MGLLGIGNQKSDSASDILPAELFEKLQKTGSSDADHSTVSEFELRFASGESKWMETTVKEIEICDSRFRQLSLKDISKSKLRESELEREATTDDLSGLANRRQFRRVLDRNACRCLAIAMVDVDHFKSINDSFGHTIGDHAIRFVAGQLLRHFEEELCVARLGGEEFAVVCEFDDRKLTEEKFESFRQAVEVGHFFGTSLRLTVSIGLAFSDDAEEIGDLLFGADKALYTAKNSGRNRLALHRAS